MKLLAILALVILGVAILFLTKVTKTESVAKNSVVRVVGQGKDQDLVPPPMEIQHGFTVVESLPEISVLQMTMAISMILKFEGNPVLSTPDDREIFAHLKEYVEGKRVMDWVGEPEPLVVLGKPATAAMAFNCRGDGSEDNFGIGPLQWSTESVALVMYHEVKHAVDCKKYHLKYGVRRNPDDVSREDQEKVAYAAQVRFFVALHMQDMLPKTVSRARYGDSGIIANMQEVWEAILNNRFSEWYRQASENTGPKELKPGTYIKVND